MGRPGGLRPGAAQSTVGRRPVDGRPPCSGGDGGRDGGSGRPHPGGPRPDPATRAPRLSEAARWRLGMGRVAGRAHVGTSAVARVLAAHFSRRRGSRSGGLAQERLLPRRRGAQAWLAAGSGRACARPLVRRRLGLHGLLREVGRSGQTLDEPAQALRLELPPRRDQGAHLPRHPGPAESRFRKHAARRLSPYVRYVRRAAHLGDAHPDRQRVLPVRAAGADRVAPCVRRDVRRGVRAPVRSVAACRGGLRRSRSGCGAISSRSWRPWALSAGDRRGSSRTTRRPRSRCR